MDSIAETADKRIEQRAAFSTNRFRPSVDASVLQHDSVEILYNRTRKFIHNITNRYVNYDHPVGYIEVDLHDLWYLLIETAKITPANEATAERLVHQVLLARELGQLSRVVAPPKVENDNTQSEEPRSVQVESAITSTSARIWTDLPFLVTDLRAAWASSIMKMSAIERENLAAFTARLTALGVCDPQLTSCALILFREALETPRRLIANDVATEVANEAEDVPDVPLSELLPALLAWLRHGSYKILSLCARNHLSFEDGHIDNNEKWTVVGELMAVEEQQHPGFNMPRWQYWKRRLEEVGQNTKDESVAEQGRKCCNIMESWEKYTGGKTHDRETARDIYFGERD
jgi:hypothetical protein